MTYATERDAAIRTPQAILVLGVPLCQNFYAQIVAADSLACDDFNHVTLWVKTATVTSNTHAAPDGSITADTVAFAGVGDFIRNAASNIVAANHAVTESVWLRTLSGTGTITVEARDGSDTEGNTVVLNLTTTWTRFIWHKLFSGAAGGNVMWRMKRAAGDLASVVAWRANTTRNPGDVDRDFPFPSVPQGVNASRCSAADAGDGNRCGYTFQSCQAPADFNPGNDYEATPELRGLREYKFCLRGQPLPFVGGSTIRPMLTGWEQAPQEIDGTRGALDKDSHGGFVTRNEEVTYRLDDDPNPGVWDLDKQSIGALVNTGAGGGTFWRRWRAIHGNFDNPRGYAKLSTGYIFAGSTEADYRLRLSGPMLRLQIANGGTASLQASDGLRMTKRKIPSKISDTNLLTVPIDASVTSITVRDPSEISDPAPNADAAETFTLGRRTGGPDWKVVLQFGAEKMNLIAKTNGGNPLTVQRGRWGTVGIAHATNETFSELREFGTEQTVPANPVLGANPIDMKHALYREAGIPWYQIDTTFNNDERDTWADSFLDVTFGIEGGVLFRDTVSTPTEIDGLLQTIDRDLVSFQFVTDDRLIRTKIFAPVRPTETLVELTDVTGFTERSVSVDLDLEARLSRVIVAYSLILGQAGDKFEDFAKGAIAINPSQEGPGAHGTIRDRIILSRWIRPTDSGRGAATAARILNRFINGARIVKGEIEAKDDDNVTLGSFCYVTTAQIQKPDGSTDGKLIMLVTHKERSPDGQRMTLQFLDTAISGRFWFWQPSTAPASYDVATDDERRKAFWANALGKVGATNAAPYLWY